MTHDDYLAHHKYISKKGGPGNWKYIYGNKKDDKNSFIEYTFDEKTGKTVRVKNPKKLHTHPL